MNLYEELIARKEKISLVGLGYVGLPIAVAFAKKVDVVGFDINEEKVELYKQGIDPTLEVGDEVISKTTVDFTSNPERLKECKFHIVAVPTPISDDRKPDLTPLESSAKTVGQNLVKGSIVVFESTVYPGVTEDICIPILEKESGLQCGVDFKVGYSPERINPGDKIHRLDTIVKVVSGMDHDSLETIAKVYELVVDAGIHKASTIKVAEAAKVIENAQRDINIAFMNELSMIFHLLDIDTKEVLEAAGTKWNFLPFEPGLVGGHCIGIDPYYLTYKAEVEGYHPQIILSGRKINDGMGSYIVDSLLREMVRNNINVSQAKVGILGLTFKENCPDIRNTRVVDIIEELESLDLEYYVHDPYADPKEVQHEYGIKLTSLEDMKDLDVVIIPVAHTHYKEGINLKDMFKDPNAKNLVFDIKGILDKKTEDFKIWRL